MNIYASEKTLPYVYKLTHKETNQFYIGVRWANKVPSTQDLGTHYFSSSKHIKQLGFDNFEITIIAEFFDAKTARDFEKELIVLNHPLSLNKHNGEKFYCSGPRSVNTKEKMSVWQIGRTLPQSTKDKISLANRGNKWSQEAKDKLSKSLKGRKLTKPRSEEWKLNQRITRLGRKDTKEMFNNKSKAQSGENNPRSKTWLLLSEFGIFLELRSLKPWAKSMNINPDTLATTFKTGKFHKGWSLIEREL